MSFSSSTKRFLPADLGGARQNAWGVGLPWIQISLFRRDLFKLGLRGLWACGFCVLMQCESASRV